MGEGEIPSLSQDWGGKSPRYRGERQQENTTQLIPPSSSPSAENKIKINNYKIKTQIMIGAKWREEWVFSWEDA